MTQFHNNKVRLTGGPAKYYMEYTTTNLFVEKTFGAQANTLSISNDSDTDDIQISYDGATLEADIKSGETQELHMKGQTRVYIKATAGGDKVRIWAW